MSTSETKVVAAEAVEAWRRKRRLERTKTVELPKREVPSNNYVYTERGRRETVNSRIRRLMEQE